MEVKAVAAILFLTVRTHTSKGAACTDTGELTYTVARRCSGGDSGEECHHHYQCEAKEKEKFSTSSSRFSLATFAENSVCKSGHFRTELIAAGGGRCEACQ